MTKYIIDSHAHLDNERFDEDRDEIIQNLDNDNVLAVIIPSCDIKSSHDAINLSNKYNNVYAMVGTHPHESKDFDEDLYKEYLELAKTNKKVVAVGEIGLDYHYDFSPREKQKEVFIKQIELAKELDLPIVIHSREAYGDTYEILEKYARGMKVLLHSFNETWEECKKYLDLGFYISFGGMMTFKNSKNLIRVVENAPIDKFLLETDAPYLTPVPHRGKRNEPKYTHFVAKRVSEMRVEDIEYIRENTNKNTIKFFGLDIDGKN